MAQFPEKHHRRSIRLDGYDYTQWGAYFITLITYHRQPLFGKLKKGFIELSDLGNLATRVWFGLETRFPSIQLDEFVIMPDHIHGIIIFGEMPVRARQKEVTRSGSILLASHQVQLNRYPSLGQIVSTYKSTVSRLYNTSHKTIGERIWHRNYYERIIRDEMELGQIRLYIQENPLRFGEEKDKDYPWDE